MGSGASVMVPINYILNILFNVLKQIPLQLLLIFISVVEINNNSNGICDNGDFPPFQVSMEEGEAFVLEQIYPGGHKVSARIAW